MQDITITNFRCYAEKHMAFRKGVNLLIGDNSVGKTSLIRACNFVINSFFSGYSDENTNWHSVDDNDFRLVIGSDNTILPENPIDISFHLGEWEFPNFGNTTLDKTKEQKIEKKSKKNSRNLVTGLKELKDYSSKLLRDSYRIENTTVIQDVALPLYCCFTTEDIHATRKINREKFKEYNHKPSFGYYECYDCKGLFEYWLDRLIILDEAEIGSVEIQIVKQAVIDALGENGCGIINDMIIRSKRGKVYFKYTDERLVESGMLSDGYRRLVSMIVDMAFRCAILNKTIFGENCCRNTWGTVIIDEIDEHLHPELQIKIIKALHDTFPNIQFIISTHAPLVMSSVEANEDNIVYKLDYDDEEQKYIHSSLNTYGLDANLILEEEMGVFSRVKEIKELIDKAYNSIRERNITDAKEKLAELERKTSPNQPELVKIRAIINRIETIGR